MNDFFGMTPERIQEIQDQIEAIGESLRPLQDAADVLMGEQDPHAMSTTESEAPLLAAAGLLCRLDQSLGEAHFWAQGVQSYMTRETPDQAFYTRLAWIVIEAYGGVRDLQDPYGKGSVAAAISEVIGLGGLGDLLGGPGTVVVTVRVGDEEPASEPASEPAT